MQSERCLQGHLKIEQGTGSLMKGRKKDACCGIGLTVKTFLYIEQHPVTSTLCHILMGREVLGELAITIVDTNAYVHAPTVTSLNRLPAGVTIKC